MFVEIILTIFFTISVLVHQVILLLFAWSISRVIFCKYTPYSSLYIAIVCLIQTVYNGCPITDLNNYLAYKTGLPKELNSFWGGFFQDYNIFGRVGFLVISAIFFYYFYKNWDKAEVRLDWKRPFKSRN